MHQFCSLLFRFLFQASQRSNTTSLPKLTPISPVERENNIGVEDMRVSSPVIKQEPHNDNNPLIDSFHSMSEALQTVSGILFKFI